MRISDWSSDVCSSDLAVLARKIEEQAFRLHAAACHQQGLCELRPQRGEAFEQLGTVLEAHGPGDFFQCLEDGALHSGDPQILSVLGARIAGCYCRSECIARQVEDPDRKSTRLNSSH